MPRQSRIDTPGALHHVIQGGKTMRRILLMLLVILMAVVPAAAEFQISLNPDGNSGTKTWSSPQGTFSFDYPIDWEPEKPLKDGGVQLYKPGKGWFELSLIPLPDGEDLKGFSDHLIQKSRDGAWDIKLEANLGFQEIGGKPCWVHKYRHKEKNRIYYGYQFVSVNESVGIRVLMSKISRKGGETMMKMLDSLKGPGLFPSEEKATKPSAEEAVSPVEEAAIPAAYALEFGTYQEEGNVKGKVLLKDLGNRGVFPCFISFQPLRWKTGQRNRTQLENYETEGTPVFTATNDRGQYHVDLPEGNYRVQVYNREGVFFPIKRGELLRRTPAKRLHNIRIENY